MTNAESTLQEYKKQLQYFGFPENQLIGRTERELLSMKTWALNFNQQCSGRWNYQVMGGGHIEENFFALSKVEKRA
jgi:hypothetical protein